MSPHPPIIYSVAQLPEFLSTRSRSLLQNNLSFNCENKTVNMNPNWSFSTQKVYKKIEIQMDELIKRSLVKAKNEMINLIKETYRRENADTPLSDKEVEKETRPQVEEVTQAIMLIGERRGIDTSSLVVEVGSDNRGDDHDDEANEGDIDTEEEEKANDDNKAVDNAEAIGTTRSRPPKRSHRRSIRDQSFKPRGKANIRAIHDIIMSPNAHDRLRSAARSAAIQDSHTQDTQEANAQEGSAQDAFDRAEIVPRQLTFSNVQNSEAGSASSGDQGPETSTPNKKMKMPIEIEVVSSDDGPPVRG